ncbi:hypothetical protein R5H30_11705 [Sulfitobacter sp. D35]|uniref:hypothetical protein n=1 Tax=Sulfitobacter sp. D35 TaxID=3083252 RepID=UPI00296F6A6A|nr:hypothetical protein [Sulfitobacter sp. D35]MDW4498650.1 hypothetical protein [Sulfitobacter sp. D35]
MTGFSANSFIRGCAAWLAGALLAVFLANPVTAGARSDLVRPDRSDYLNLARSGWVFEFNTRRMRRPADLPPIRFDSAEVATGEICLFGDPPKALSRQIIHSFTELLREVYERRLAVTFAGREIENCPPHQRVYIRLYSGAPPYARLNADLRLLDREFDIRFPPNWNEPVRSPAQANGFFGRRGASAHLLISQPPTDEMSDLQRDYYTSILVEELFQVVSFGADILKADRESPFLSKLQEAPVNLRYVPWNSERYMTGLLRSNPKGLCGFDVFMLHALAAADLESANSAELLDFIETHFDDLRARTERTLRHAAYAPMIDSSCAPLPD